MIRDRDSKFTQAFDAVLPDAVVATNGFSVETQFRTNSGKGTWTAHFDFDEETGDCRYYAPYRSASSPWAFGNEVIRRLREAAADRQSAPTE